MTGPNEEDEQARRRAEEELLRTKDALRQSQERLTAALAASGTCTFHWDISTDAIAWDGNLQRLFGVSSEATLTPLGAFLDAIHPADRPAVQAAYQQSARAGSPLDVQFRIVCPDGEVRWVDDKALVFTDAGGKPLYVTGACADITPLKNTEEALRENEQRLRAIFNQAAIGIASAALDGRFVDMNRKVPEILGYTEEQL